MLGKLNITYTSEINLNWKVNWQVHETHIHLSLQASYNIVNGVCL